MEVEAFFEGAVGFNFEIKSDGVSAAKGWPSSCTSGGSKLCALAAFPAPLDKAVELDEIKVVVGSVPVFIKPSIQLKGAGWVNAAMPDFKLSFGASASVLVKLGGKFAFNGIPNDFKPVVTTTPYTTFSPFYDQLPFTLSGFTKAALTTDVTVSPSISLLVWKMFPFDVQPLVGLKYTLAAQAERRLGSGARELQTCAAGTAKSSALIQGALGVALREVKTFQAVKSVTSDTLDLTKFALSSFDTVLIPPTTLADSASTSFSTSDALSATALSTCVAVGSPISTGGSISALGLNRLMGRLNGDATPERVSVAAVLLPILFLVVIPLFCIIHRGGLPAAWEQTRRAAGRRLPGCLRFCAPWEEARGAVVSRLPFCTRLPCCARFPNSWCELAPGAEMVGDGDWLGLFGFYFCGRYIPCCPPPAAAAADPVAAAAGDPVAAFHHACHAGDEAAVRAALAASPALLRAPEKGTNFLPLVTCLLGGAAAAPALRVLKELATPADLRATCASGRSLLHFAATGHAAGCEGLPWLLREGLPPSAADADGVTPLHCAVQNLHAPAEAAALLIAAGANARAKNAKGATPVDVARLLAEHGVLADARALLAALGEKKAPKEHPLLAVRSLRAASPAAAPAAASGASSPRAGGSASGNEKV
jgi:hypothetical protein